MRHQILINDMTHILPYVDVERMKNDIDIMGELVFRLDDFGRLEIQQRYIELKYFLNEVEACQKP